MYASPPPKATVASANWGDCMTKITQLTNQLGEILLPRGYKKAGKNFYRVQGDGVIVLFGFDYERRDYGHNLCYGIYSLYNPALRQPKEYHLSNHVLTKSDLQEFSHLKWVETAQLTPQAVQSSSDFMKFLYSGADEQNQKRNTREFEILKERDFLERIDNITDFAKAFDFIIEMEMRDNRWAEYRYYWYFYELLLLGRYEEAIKVFHKREKMDYWGAYYTVIQTDFYYYEERWARLESHFAVQRSFVRLLEAGNTDEVQKRLREIYVHNLATFGVRKKRKNAETTKPELSLD